MWRRRSGRAVGRYRRLGFRHIDSNEICDLMRWYPCRAGRAGLAGQAVGVCGVGRDSWMTCDRTSAPTVLPYFSSRPLIRLEHLLPQPNRLRRHFHQFVVVDEFDRLFESEESRWDQADGFVGR
jgi:hypothetical protein